MPRAPGQQQECQLRRELPQGPDRRRLIVDKYAPLAVGTHLTSQQHLVAVEVEPIGLQHSFGSGRGLEDAAQQRLFRPVPHQIAGCLAPQQHDQRVDQNRFPRARFAGEQIQSRPKLCDRSIDHREVFRSQFQQHAVLTFAMASPRQRSTAAYGF